MQVTKLPLTVHKHVARQVKVAVQMALLPSEARLEKVGLHMYDVAQDCGCTCMMLHMNDVAHE